MLEYADDYAEESIVFKEFFPGLGADVGHEGKDLENLFLDFNVDFSRHEHSEERFDVMSDGGCQVFISLVNESAQQFNRALYFLHLVLEDGIVDFL